MDCIVWAQEKASALRAEDSEDCDVMSDSSSDEVQLGEEEVDAIRKLPVVAGAQDSAHEMPIAEATSQIVETGGQQESIEEILGEWDEDSDLVRFHAELSKRLDALGGERNLRWQILVAIKENFDGYLRKTRENQHMEARVARRNREQRLIDMGIEEELVQRMPDDPMVAYPETLQRAVDKCAVQVNATSYGQREMRAKEIFEDVWLQAKEYELFQLAKDLEGCHERDVRQAKEYCLGVASDALRGHHIATGTDPQIGLEVRRRVYLENGWIPKGQEARITDLYSPPKQGILCESKLLLTPPSSQPRSQRKRRSATQLNTAAKGQKTMHDFLFSSQK